MDVKISVQTEDFDLAHEYAELCQSASNPGAVAIFSGLVRELVADDVPGALQSAGTQSLTLEHYPGMTEKALTDIVDKAANRWPLQACRLIHRVGELQPGEQIVLVAVASAHREAAFAAAEFMMDYLKTDAPFWKKQRNGDDSVWVASRDSDYRRVERWRGDTDLDAIELDEAGRPGKG
nr:molybdopterin synthase catalytic subunit MoaE [Pseudohongiella spirulinae]